MIFTELFENKTSALTEGVRVIDQDYDLDQLILTMDINGRRVSFTYTDYDENFENAERGDVHDQLQRNDWYATLSHPDRMEILDAAYRAIRGEEPGEYRPTVDDEPQDVVDRLGEQGVAEGEKKPYPKTWHDVDPKLGKQVDKMSQAEKVKKGLAHPDTLKKKGVAEGILGDREYNRVMPFVKRIASEVSDYDRDEFGEELWSLLDQRYGAKFAQSVLADLDFYWDTYTELAGQGLDEASVYKKDQDLSGVSTQELEAFVRKNWGGGIPTYGQGQSVKRAMRELRRRQKQGVAEAMKPSDIPPSMRQRLTMRDIEAERPQGAFRFRVTFPDGHTNDYMTFDAAKSAADREKGRITNLKEDPATKKKDTALDEAGKDACYHKVKSRYKVWPSAYASGALVQCRKQGAANWGTGGKKK